MRASLPESHREMDDIWAGQILPVAGRLDSRSRAERRHRRGIPQHIIDFCFDGGHLFDELFADRYQPAGIAERILDIENVQRPRAP